jgi:hypothetical protein
MRNAAVRESPTPRAGRPWTRDDDIHLRTLAEEAKSFRAIAMEINRTIEAVRRRARSLKVPVNRPTEIGLKAKGK